MPAAPDPAPAPDSAPLPQLRRLPQFRVQGRGSVHPRLRSARHRQIDDRLNMTRPRGLTHNTHWGVVALRARLRLGSHSPLGRVCRTWEV
jgi:hypothetical protein